jgi:RNA polymerase sigma factor (sigma-70 family)
MTAESRGSVFRSIHTLFGVGSLTGMTDGQLLEQFLARKDEVAEAAFAALVAIHGPMVWKVCRGVLNDAHAAEDAFQATFLILVRKAGSIRRRETLAPWLYGVARRVAVRAKASATRRRIHEGTGAERVATSMPHRSEQEELLALHEELDRLPERYRAAVVLCHLQGRTHAEAARLLNCPTGTVSFRVSRARELLRQRLTRRGLALSAAMGLALGPESAWAAVPAALAESTIKAAMYVASGKVMTAGVVPAAVSQLTEGVLRTMSVNKLTITATCLLAAGLVPAGIALLARGAPAQDKSGAAAPAHQEDVQKARGESVNNLRTISLAMHNYYAQSKTNSFPASAILSKDGKPVLSWRVRLLPYLGQQALYDKFDFDKPWLSPHNKALVDQIPEVFAPVIKKDEPKGSTYYQVFVGPGAFCEGDLGTNFESITGGTANTLMVVEAAKPVPWTKPEDLSFDKDKPLPKLGGQFERGFHAAFADGSVLFISKTINDKLLRALITRIGVTPRNGVIPPDDPELVSSDAIPTIP